MPRLTGLPTFVFSGDKLRVQLQVFDWSGAHWSGDPTKFSVSALPASAHKSTAFSRGKKLYHGTNFHEAWRFVCACVGEQSIPRALAKYLAE